MTSHEKSSSDEGSEPIDWRDWDVESPGGVFHPQRIEVQDFGCYGLIVDLRSRADYEDDHIPGAVHLEVTVDAHRPPLATGDSSPGGVPQLQDSAMPLDLPPALGALVAAVPMDERILLYCGSGGRISQPLAQALRWRGRDVDVLGGGWINYRRWVQAGLGILPRLLRLRVIRSALASEQAHVLQALQAAGHQVLDVHALAGWQRGVPPTGPQPAQAGFESQLVHAMRQSSGLRPVWTGELGPQIGGLAMPGGWLAALEIAPVARLEVPLPARVRQWRTDEAALAADVPALLAELARSTARPDSLLMTRWRQLAAQADIDGLLASVLADDLDARLAAQAAQLDARRQQMPALQAANLEPATLLTAVKAWLPMPD